MKDKEEMFNQIRWDKDYHQRSLSDIKRVFDECNITKEDVIDFTHKTMSYFFWKQEDEIIEEIFNHTEEKGTEQVRRSCCLISRLFLRELKTKDETRELLTSTEYYKDKDIEKEIDYIYNTSIDILKEEYENDITLNNKKGFTK
jgi:hypothetical protein